MLRLFEHFVCCCVQVIVGGGRGEMGDLLTFAAVTTHIFIFLLLLSHGF